MLLSTFSAFQTLLVLLSMDCPSERRYNRARMRL